VRSEAWRRVLQAVAFTGFAEMSNDFEHSVLRLYACLDTKMYDDWFTWPSPAIKIRYTLMNWIRLPLRPRAGSYRRALSCLLVAMLAYGSTVAAGHSHGVCPNPSKAVAISDPDGSHSSDTGHSRHTECSMCQFQQQLFNGFVHTPCLTPTTSSQLSSVCTPAVGYSSISTKAQRGRGPPSISL